ncbi:MAG: trimeric intracellular cation channel family protein [Emcibacter sp.]|nr:trimeric intracellular cation channel family protein [Emcibacter sp.]
MEDFIYGLGLMGIAVFAVSGALAAMRRELDPFGLVVIAIVTAIGGGTIRDIILDTPVFWIQNPTSLYIAISVAIITPFWGRYLESRMTVLIWADACGLALFAVTGTEKALSLGAIPVVAVTMGLMTAAAGGMIRDILCNEIPLVLKKELYALPAIIGGSCLVILSMLDIDHRLSILLSCGLTLTIRLVAIKYSLSLPPVEKR